MLYNCSVSSTKLNYNPSTGTLSSTVITSTSDKKYKINILFQAINNDPDDANLIEKIDESFNDGTFFIARDENGQTILIRVLINRKINALNYIRNKLQSDYSLPPHYSTYMDFLNVEDKNNKTYYDYYNEYYNEIQNRGQLPQGGGSYKMYNNRKYKIYTGKRGGKYICVGIEKKKIYI